MASIDTNTGLLTAWNPKASKEVYTISVSGSTVYAGGTFNCINFENRNRIAAFDALTGAATPWNPNSNGIVYSLDVSESKVYAGGSFTAIGGQSRNRIAAIDPATGLLSSWNPGANGLVGVIAVVDNVVFVGGQFTNIGGLGRVRLAALDANTGLATSWQANAGDFINTIAISGSLVYVGGGFTTIRQQSRNNIAALDINNGQLDPWNPNANDEVLSITVAGSTVYAAGQFTSIGGQTRNRIAALDVNSGLATEWNPNSNNLVYALDVAGSTVYAGGTFTSIGGQNRNRLAAIDATTGDANNWNPNSNNIIYSIASQGTSVFAGGSFTSMNNRSVRGFAAFTSADCLGIENGPAVPGSPCFVNGFEGTYDESCTCIANPVLDPCRYFMSNYNTEGGSDIYECTFDDLNKIANLTYLFSTANKVSIAVNELSGSMVLVGETGDTWQFVNLLTNPVSIGVQNFSPQSIGNLTGAAYRIDGTLFVAGKQPGVIRSVSITPPAVNTFSTGPVDGGDIVFDPNGDLYLISRTPQAAFKINPGSANTNISALPANASGLARRGTNSYLLMFEGNGNLLLVDASAINNGVNYQLLLDGAPFIPNDGDLASGCINPQAAFAQADETIGMIENTLLYALPNPAEGISTVVYRPASSTRALLELYDIRGVLIATIFNRDVEGEQVYSSQFDASHLPNGVYFYRLSTPNHVAVEKLLIAR